MMMGCAGTLLQLAAAAAASLLSIPFVCLRAQGGRAALTGPKTHPRRTKCMV